MYSYKYLALVLLLTASACSSGLEYRDPPPGAGPDRSVDELYVERFVLEDFQRRLDAATTFYDTGDRYLFAATRDSLVVDVNAYIRENPHSERDPQFVRLLNHLSRLDTLDTEPVVDAISPEDSLALEYADWPELDIELDDGVLFSKYNTVFPEIENSRIDFWLQYFTGPGKRRFERAVYRMQLYRPIVDKILDELDLPPELICLALIESGYSMKAVSHARAVGPWQFIYGTAKLYRLRVDWWFDERRDIVASTYAAGNYLKDLHSIWGDWFLAFAAYNCGEYRVARAIARQRSENFWHLTLPRQTQRYVPKFLAALYILRDPDKYGIKVADVEALEFDEVRITDGTDLQVIARCAETTVETIRELNPACRRWATPPNTEVVIKVPVGKGESCRQNLEKIPSEERITWRRHKVRRGETLSTIAARYGTSVTALKRLNNIRNRHFIREGHSLIVPLRGDYTEVARSKPDYKTASRKIDKEALERYAKRDAPPKGYKRIVYVVKEHDTLGEIAEVYKTSARKLRSWNNLSYRRFIYPGQKLAIYVPESFREPEVARAAPPETLGLVKHQHVVQKGETFYSISRKYNVRLDELLAWNRRSHRSIIHPGDVLDVWRDK